VNLIDRIRFAMRAFVLGPLVVERSDEAWGHPIEEWAPAEYGQYIATSNGVYACATQRAQFLSSLPLALYKLNARGDRSQVTGGPLYSLLKKVNDFWTFNRLIEMTELSLCLWGQAFWFLERGDSGVQTPSEIWWGRPDRVRVIPHPERYIAGYYYLPLNGVREVAYRPSEVLWIRLPNPNDEYAPLSPLAAARLAADYASAGMKSNKNLFDNGIQMGGMVSPRAGQTFTDEQAKAIEEAIKRRFQGVDKSHKWAVFRFDAEVKPVGFNPKEAEFLGGLKWSLEDICRAYHWPIDLVGGQRTYENYNSALKAAWENCVLPQGKFISTEITEQLLPMFPNQADVAEFDASEIGVLQEAEGAQWTRAKEQIGAGVIVINEWRDEQGLKPVPWGDVWWAPANLLPVDSGEVAPVAAPAAPAAQAGQEQPPAGGQAGVTHAQTRVVEYGSDEHQRLFARFVRRTTGYEKQVTRVTVDLFRRQQDSVLARLKQRAARSVEDAADEPFDMAQWIKSFRTEARPVLLTIVEDAGQQALEDLALTMAFDVAQPAVARFLERRAQRFAQRVNETTWERLKSSLQEGIATGENIAQFEQRVLDVMAERIRSTPETIARTEVNGAANGGTLEAWRQSDVVATKTWLAGLDDRTRQTHVDAHGQTRKLDEDFEVGAGRGPAPGQIGLAEEDIDCRCSMTAGMR